MYFKNISKHIFSYYRSLANLNETKIANKVPPSDGLPIFGSLFSFIRSGSSPKLHLYIDAKHKKLGPIFREKILSKSTIFLSDPDKIREVFSVEGKYPSHILPESWLLYNQIYNRKRGLLFMEKEEWLHYRKIMNLYLLKDSSLNDIIKETCNEVVGKLVKKWNKFAGTDKGLINLDKDLYVHSISFMLATAMGMSYKDYSHVFISDVEHLASCYQNIFKTTSKLMVVPVELSSKLNLSSWKCFVSALDESLKESEAVIDKLKKYKSDDGLFTKLLEAGLNERMINVLLIDLMMAAGDTTAYTMQWALYLLGKHTSIQSKVRSDHDLIRGVIKETLRLYPAAPFLSRKIHQPLELSPYHVPAGEMIVMSMYTCGRSESNFPNPEQYHPQRWNRNEDGHYLGVSNKFASLPFAMGVRSCVGKKLAETLMTSTIKQILTNFKLTTTNDVNMILRLTPAPSRKIKITIEKC